jgi:hypothetical protein
MDQEEDIEKEEVEVKDQEGENKLARYRKDEKLGKSSSVIQRRNPLPIIALSV